jgi:hypothetical protein
MQVMHAMPVSIPPQNLNISSLVMILRNSAKVTLILEKGGPYGILQFGY